MFYQTHSFLPKYLKESGCNDGISFPFIYIGLCVLTRISVGEIAKKWFLTTILWQCIFGTLGLVIGHAAYQVLRFSHSRNMIGSASYLAFYLLLAPFSIGAASTLDVDDFLVAFSAGVGFAREGNSPTAQALLPVIVDLLLNSTMFVFFGAVVPWDSFNSVQRVTSLATSLSSYTHHYLSPSSYCYGVTTVDFRC